jgi:hypothetical protein
MTFMDIKVSYNLSFYFIYMVDLKSIQTPIFFWTPSLEEMKIKFITFRGIFSVRTKILVIY